MTLFFPLSLFLSFLHFYLFFLALFFYLSLSIFWQICIKQFTFKFATPALRRVGIKRQNDVYYTGDQEDITATRVYEYFIGPK